jgi:hypothetical protein
MSVWCHKEIHASEPSRGYSITRHAGDLPHYSATVSLTTASPRSFEPIRHAGLTFEDMHSYVEADRRKLTQIKHVFAARGARETGGCCLSHDALYLHESTLIVVP